jgi:hypothetical protein
VMRPLIAARCLDGALLLLAPRGLLSRLACARVDRMDALVARVLGTRQLVQAGWAWRHPTRGATFAGAGVDALHAASMIALAACSPGRRRLAIHSALGAAGLALAGVVAARENRQILPRESRRLSPVMTPGASPPSVTPPPPRWRRRGAPLPRPS